MPTSISLKTITERLNLEFKEIKALYDFKVKAIKNDEKYIKLAKNILIHELNDLSHKLSELRVYHIHSLSIIIGPWIYARRRQEMFAMSNPIDNKSE